MLQKKSIMYILVLKQVLLLVTQLFLFPFSMHAQEILTNHTGDDRYPRWSPDGQYITFESNRRGNWDIYLMTADGQDVRQLTTGEADDRFPTWHPSGDRLLFSSDRSGALQLYELEIASGKLEQLAMANVSGSILFPDYSPDGRYVAFTNSSNLFVSKLSDGSTSQMTFDSLRSIYPVWSPDQTSLAFFSRRDTQGAVDEIYSYDLVSNSIQRITHWPTHNFAPAWSSNGEFIVCATSMEGSRPELFLIELKNGSLTQITENDYGDTEPDWQPRGNSIVYACQAKGNYDICLRSIDELVQNEEH